MGSSIKLKTAAYVHTIMGDEKLMQALLIFLGAFSIYAAVPFFPLPLAFIIALLPAGIGYYNPQIGVIVSSLISLVGFFYLSPIWGWLFLFILSIVLYTVWKEWHIIASLQTIIFLPFTPFPISLLGGFIYLFMLFLSFRFGSRQSLLISLPSVFLILLFSAVWQVNNSAFFPVSNKMLSSSLLSLRHRPSLYHFSSALSRALYNMSHLRGLTNFGTAVGIIIKDIFILLGSPWAWLQIITWALVLFLPPYLTGIKFKVKKIELLASSSLLIVPIGYYFVYSMLNKAYPIQIPIYTLLSLGALWAIETYFDVQLSNELKIKVKEEASKVGVSSPSFEKLTLNDVANYEDVKEELKESILMPLKRKDIAYAYHLKPIKGILLFGPPGTGKTRLIKAFASEMGYNFAYVKASDLLSSLYGETEKELAKIFKNARKQKPFLLFFDEIDAIASKRGVGSDETTARVTSSLLQELSALPEDGSVVFIAATNAPHRLDPALMRPGRIDKIIYMGPPDLEGRKKIFSYYINKIPHADIDLNKLAEKTERFTGADIENVVKEATRLATKRAIKSEKIEPVTMQDLLDVIQKIKPSISLSDLEAYETFKLDYERRVEESKEEEEEKPLTFKDVADMEKVKKALKDALEMPLLHEDLFKEVGLQPIKGILLFGPPGTGKTYITRAAAGEFNVPLIILNSAELLEKGFDKAASLLKESFNRAKENAPSIIFLDEIETLAPKRTGQNPLLGQLLSEMDGVKKLKNVVVIGATNLPSMLDPALLRPGRFDKLIYVAPPNKEARKAIFAIHLGKFKDLYDLERLASISEGFSSADIANICENIKYSILNEKLGKGKALSQRNVEKLIENTKPSITKDLLEEYDVFMRKYGERL